MAHICRGRSGRRPKTLNIRPLPPLHFNAPRSRPLSLSLADETKGKREREASKDLSRSPRPGWEEKPAIDYF